MGVPVLVAASAEAGEVPVLEVVGLVVHLMQVPALAVVACLEQAVRAVATSGQVWVGVQDQVAQPSPVQLVLMTAGFAKHSSLVAKFSAMTVLHPLLGYHADLSE